MQSPGGPVEQMPKLQEWFSLHGQGGVLQSGCSASRCVWWGKSTMLLARHFLSHTVTLICQCSFLASFAPFIWCTYTCSRRFTCIHPLPRPKNKKQSHFLICFQVDSCPAAFPQPYAVHHDSCVASGCAGWRLLVLLVSADNAADRTFGPTHLLLANAHMMHIMQKTVSFCLSV